MTMHYIRDFYVICRDKARMNPLLIPLQNNYSENTSAKISCKYEI